MKKKQAILIASFLALVLFPDASFPGLRERLAIPNFPKIKSISILGTRSGDTMMDIQIEPFDRIYAHRFTRIWWDNYSDTFINIKFGKGNRCKKIFGGSRTQFWKPYEVCYITEQPIPQNGALLIRFDEAGTYDFEIQFVGTKSSAKGVLIVF